jgi:chromate transporter
MILFGYGVGALGDLQHSGWLHGLKLAAVAVVAQAVLGMGRNLCPDIPRRALAILVVVVILLFPGALIQVGAIAAGATVGWLLYGKKETGRPDQILPGIQGHRMAIIALATFGVLLLGLPAAASATGVKAVAIFDSFYRAGALVFGGGHVVLPLLRAELVPRGWVTDDAFLAGYGAAQSLPGPLFTFASYLGTVMNPGRAASLSGLGCLFGIFLPGWLLIGGALPFWRRFQSKNWARAALQGANASVVGILAAAFYDPVWKQGVVAGRDIIIVAAAFMLLQFFRTPQWLVVGLAALAGWGWF